MEETEKESDTSALSISLGGGSFFCLRSNPQPFTHAKSPNYTATLRQIFPNIELIDSQEKFTINKPEMRKEFVLKHVNALYCDYRHKLKAKYYDDPELINRYQRENNKPRKVLKKTTKPVNEEKLANNVDAVSKLEDHMKQRNEGLNQMDDEEIFKKVLGEEKHGYFRAYGHNKSITDHFGVKPARLNLIHKVVEIEKMADKQVQKTIRKMEEKMEEKLVERDIERDKLLVERDKMWEERFKKLCDSLGIPQTNQIHQNEST
ncbi:hypothetical protein Cgig2_006384 [Carnegiea gigantea]|uniref:Uncharacterized protein n=1 Tax=Carnegiea gigantea TaxID=171969 RepID=A0A9Q1K548_9CARY|nr:hypothetical protein Cgig2_006384 [Carnegiea gigantea]